MLSTGSRTAVILILAIFQTKGKFFAVVQNHLVSASGCSFLSCGYPKSIQRVFVMGLISANVCIDRDRLFGSDPNSLPNMKTTWFFVAELSYPRVSEPWDGGFHAHVF